MMWPNMMGYYGWWGMLFGGLMTLIFLGVFVALVVLAFRAVNRTGGSSSSGTGLTALDILKERYARGEISREQYQSMRQDLEK